MSTKLFYFSATGNSYSVARSLSNKLHGVMENIADYMVNPHPVSEDVLGIITPVYCGDLPQVVEDFLHKLQLETPNYIFILCTMGGVAGRTIAHSKEILSQRGIKLSAGFTILMPDNSILLPSGKEKTEQFLFNEPINLATIAAKVQNKVETSCQDNVFWKLFHGLSMFFLLRILNVTKKKADLSKCNGCGICSMVCPAQSIHMINDKPVFKETCYNCFACAQWCPREALSVGSLLPHGKTKYIHPQVKLQEFIGQTVLEELENN